MAAAVATLAIYTAHAWTLVTYPWDWSPDEGLALDYARRLARDPGSLYARSAVPFPGAYTPLLPLVLAPFTPSSARPLLVARLLACGWTLAIVAAVYVLARRRASRPMALLAAALVVAPLDLSFWHLLIRVDGLMLALWLWSAVLLLPAELRRGADRLSRGRLWGGALLLLAAVLAKPTAALHGAPLVLGWLLVDRASALRLSAVLGGAGAAALASLELLTGGAFSWVMRLWNVHPLGREVFLESVWLFLIGAGPVLIWALLAVLARRQPLPRDGALLLLAGGLLVLPALAKAGAWWNYLLPALCGIVVLAARWWTSGPAPLAAAAGALVALGLAATRHFPVPDRGDEATARAFYAFVRQRGAPLLATRPDYAYYLLGQPVEVEGSSIRYLVDARVPGVETVLARLKRREYRLVVAVNIYWPMDPEFERALMENYAVVGTCRLGYFYGPWPFVLLAPAHDRAYPAVAPGARCQPVVAPAG